MRASSSVTYFLIKFLGILYTVFHKKTTPYLIAVTSANVGRFSKKKFTLGHSRDRVMN